MKLSRTSQVMSEQFEITNESIDLLSEKSSKFLAESGMERKNIMRLRLSLEEILLCWREKLSNEDNINNLCYKAGKRLRRPFITLSIEGERVNPFDKRNNILDEDVSMNILVNMGLAFQYEYVNGTNRVTLMPPKEKKSIIRQIIISIFAAFLLGGLCSILPEKYGVFLNTEILSPVFSTFLGFLSAIAGPMIFLSVLCGVYNMGDVATLGTIGKKLVSSFILLTIISLLIGLACCIWFFPISTSSSGSGGDGVKDIYNMLLHIIPANMLQPFIDGNSMQIIFIAVVFGLAILVLDRKVAAVTTFLDQANQIIQYIMEIIGGMIPFFIFISILNMILSGVLIEILSAIKPLSLFVLCFLAVMCIYIGALSLRTQVSPKLLIKKILPTFIIAATTASSSAAFATELDTCTKKLGVDERIANFGVPLGNVVYMPGGALFFMIVALFMAEFYSVDINPLFITVTIIMSTLLSIATPPIPGGSITCYAVLFAQLGIPVEALSLTIALDLIVDFIATAMDLACVQIELTRISYKMGMLNTTTLREDKTITLNHK